MDGWTDDTVGHLLLNQESLVGRIFLVHPETTLIHDVDHQDLSGASCNTIKKTKNSRTHSLSNFPCWSSLPLQRQLQCQVLLHYSSTLNL